MWSCCLRQSVCPQFWENMHTERWNLFSFFSFSIHRRIKCGFVYVLWAWRRYSKSFALECIWLHLFNFWNTENSGYQIINRVSISRSKSSGHHGGNDGVKKYNCYKSFPFLVFRLKKTPLQHWWRRRSQKKSWTKWRLMRKSRKWRRNPKKRKREGRMAQSPHPPLSHGGKVSVAQR